VVERLGVGLDELEQLHDVLTAITLPRWPPASST